MRRRFNPLRTTGLVAATACTLAASTASAQMSAARVWDEQMLAAIRIDTPRPPIHARNLYHVSAAMWDAWAAYDPIADQVFHHEKITGASNIEASRAEAMSYAAYRLLRWRYTVSPNAATTFTNLDNTFTSMGYDINNTDTAGNTPAALGNRIYTTIKTLALGDGANESANYVPNNGYAPVNDPLIFKLPGVTMNDPNRWQPLAFDYLVLQNGIIVGAAIQNFVCPHWAGVVPFGIRRPDTTHPYFDPGPPPLLGGATDAQFKADFTEVIRLSGQLDADDGVTINISPAARYNNPLGTNAGTGHPVNPVTGLPYAPNNFVKRGDFGRIMAEYWADGPHSETPPGHWNVIANFASDDPQAVLRIGGVGPVVNRLEWDVKMYLALNGSEHDAAVGCWGAKGFYDSVRPISAIRYMCGLGQCSNPSEPSFNANGIPLDPGLIEVITEASSAPGQRHEALAAYVGEIAIHTWKGQPANAPEPPTQAYGVGWIRAKTWMPYQKSTFVTPPFAGYTSGHSTYSRCGAEVLAGITGSPYFPGGLGIFNFAPGFLTFEVGPSQPVSLQYATYYDAADDAGISRLYGGIHIPSDDFKGRIMGARIGQTAWATARKFFHGQVSCPGDFNASGTLSVQDIFDFINAWLASPVPGQIVNPADFNEDGEISVQDIFDFLNGWFAGCSR
ncbi:MAG TPA: GC-type dockerin domain-anchored protein [Phycisphaerales bacterium]|nr:GC-type dockerin domain-anchored protein [Phycisphaerales bacterium]